MQEQIDEIVNVQKRIKTRENWIPNFEDDMLIVSLALIDNGSTYRVCVRGADNFSMIKDFKFFDLLEAMVEYMYVTDYATQSDLLSRGFIVG